MTYHDYPLFWKEAFEQGLKEDQVALDWTTLASVLHPEHIATARLIAKSAGVWVGQGLAQLAQIQASAMGVTVEFRSEIVSGTSVDAGTTVCTWKGPAGSLLLFERTFLNLAGFVSGIATQTRNLVRVVEQAGLKNPPRITHTRKTLPYYKDLSVLGVLMGGGFAHRVNLSGGILIKENHITAAGGLREAILGAKKNAPHPLRIEIEVRDEKEFTIAQEAGAEIILLDNFTPAQVQKTLSLKRSPTLIEVSGGISESNLRAYCLEGVDVISIGSLTHSVKPLDLSLLIQD